ncbi:uncharacterized protein LOC131201789 [Ahaetulla prasina]|uniref:uncharacterized protein LOC131201789 n=1 Tax=Ahaetulla prasina TaxID=499056 RepID=UPI002647C082|nr:uncharacterized protein LOC131201789 [Ahaetulla prasina]
MMATDIMKQHCSERSIGGAQRGARAGEGAGSAQELSGTAAFLSAPWPGQPNLRRISGGCGSKEGEGVFCRRPPPTVSTFGLPSPNSPFRAISFCLSLSLYLASAQRNPPAWELHLLPFHPSFFPPPRQSSHSSPPPNEFLWMVVFFFFNWGGGWGKKEKDGESSREDDFGDPGTRSPVRVGGEGRRKEKEEEEKEKKKKRKKKKKEGCWGLVFFWRFLDTRGHWSTFIFLFLPSPTTPGRKSTRVVGWHGRRWCTWQAVSGLHSAAESDLDRTWMGDHWKSQTLQEWIDSGFFLLPTHGVILNQALSTHTEEKISPRK